MTDETQIQKTDEELDNEPELKRDTYRKYRLGGNVVVREREEAVKDLMDSGTVKTEEEANKIFDEYMISFIGQRVNIDFVENEENLLGVIRKLKDMVETEIRSKGIYADQFYFDMLEQIRKVYKD